MCDRSEYVPASYARWEGRNKKRRPSLEALAAKYAPAPDRPADRNEAHDRAAAEHHAAAETSGLPGVRRHRGNVLPDNAPEKWEVRGE